MVSESPTTETRVAEARNDKECPDEFGAGQALASAAPSNSSAATEPNAAKSPALSTCRRDDSRGNERDCMRSEFSVCRPRRLAEFQGDFLLGVNESPITDTRVVEARNDEARDDAAAVVAPSNSSAAIEPNAASSPAVSTCRRDDSRGNDEDCMLCEFSACRPRRLAEFSEISGWGCPNSRSRVGSRVGG
jgi:hypothetical protein